MGGDAESRGRLRERIGPILVNAFFRRQLNHDFALNLTSGIAHRPPCCAAMCIWQFTKEYFKTVFPAKVRNELVFSEGGIDEFLRKPTGYGIKSIGKRGGLIASRVPRPDLTILLPDTNAGFSQLLNRRVEFHPNRYLILNRNETEETQAAAIIQCAIHLLCNREQSLTPLI